MGTKSTGELRQRRERGVASGRAGGDLRRSIGVGGGVVIVGIILMLALSFWVGLIVILIGLIAFGGFAKGKWY